MRRKLDDSDLDSGDDEGRDDRLADTVEDEVEETHISEVQANMAPVRLPEGDEVGRRAPSALLEKY